MLSSTPAELQFLLCAPDADACERAWTDFLTQYSRLLLHVARAYGGDHDAVMDRYAFMVEVLRRDDFRRLRGYISDGRGKFTTWLLVVARRLCLDEHRHRYGRPQGDGAATADQRAERRNLSDLVGVEMGLANLEAPVDGAPDAVLRHKELSAALDRTLVDLDASDRLLLRLRFEEDLSVPEIARLLAADSPFPLYHRLKTILAALRQALEAIGVEDSIP
jgi:RNA polymerase sigma factor (sigma-70 family)